jgi:hypothetical protein
MNFIATAVTATPPASPAAPAGRQLVESGAAALEALPGDIAQLPLLQHFSAVMPVPDLLFGGGMLVLIMLVHGIGVHSVTGAVVRRSQDILRQPAMWRADLLMSGAVFALLGLHVLEIFLWAAALVYGGLIPNWRLAGLFSGSTYTTIGYSTILPLGWGMLAPLIAISGLFTFGWSGSVLVDLIRRCQAIKDAAAAKSGETRELS